MKRNNLHRTYVGIIRLFTIISGCLIMYPTLLKSQTETYYSDNGHIVATTDSRMGATIVETDSTVIMEVFFVGEVRADALNFAFFFDPAVLFVTDTTLTKNFEYAIGNSQIYKELESAVKIDPAFKNFEVGNVIQKEAGTNCPAGNCSYNLKMGVLMPQVFLENSSLSTIITVLPHQIKHVYTCYFKKKSHGVPLKPEDIGIAAKTSYLGGQYAPKWAYDGMELVYNHSYSGVTKLADTAVLYRTTSLIATDSVNQITTHSATLHGNFKTGSFPNIDNLLNLNTQTTTGTGRLRGDVIVEQGFIYADFDADIKTGAFSDLYIDGTAYPPPNANEIAAHTFTRGGNTFYISTTSNTNTSQNVTYSTPISNLSQPKYWAWSFMTYKFENSQPYPAVGSKINFTLEEPICELLIGSIYIESQPTCSAPGSIRIHVSGGSGQYEYSIDEGVSYLPYTHGLITGLRAGTYRIYVREINSRCPASISDAILLEATDAHLALSVTPSNADACGSATGSLTVHITGGDVTTYQYRLNKGAWTNAAHSQKLSNLTPGIYVVDVKDGQSCEVSSGEIEINTQSGAELSVSVTSTDAACTTPTGMLTLTVTGNSTYKYQIDGGALFSMTGNSVTVTKLAAGVHAWRVIDQAGCYAEGRREIVNSDNPNFTVKISNTMKADCSGTGGGGFTIHITGTATFYEYSLDGGATYNAMTGTTHTLNTLASGVYDVKVRDHTGCTYEYQNIKIEKSTDAIVSVSSIYIESQPTCSAPGSIRVNISGGSGQYEYSVNAGTTYTPFANGLIAGLPSGTYRIYVREVNSICPAAVSEAIVLEATDVHLALIVTPSNADACGSATGSLTVHITGGDVTTYQYRLNKGEWTNAAHSQKLSNLTPGIYVVDVKDGQSCEVSSGEIEINTQSGAELPVSVTSTDATCTAPNGTLTLTVTGNSIYKYQIDGGAESFMAGNSVTVSNLAAGMHVWRVIDQAGCYAKGRREIINSDNPNFTVKISNTMKADCSGTGGGGFTINITGTATFYEYSLDGGTTYNAMTGATHTLNALAAGVYDIKVRDHTGCTYEYQNVIIEKGETPTSPVANTPQSFCVGATVAHLQATGLNIQWYAMAVGDTPLANNTPLINGNVYYASQNLYGCESTMRTAVKVIIDNNIILDAPKIKSPQNFCGAATIADIATNGNTNIVWYDAAMDGNPWSITTPLIDGNSYYAAISAGTCQSATRTEVAVTITNTLPNAPVINTPQHFCKGAVLSNVLVPNNQIVWYADAATTVALPAHTVLQTAIYFAAQKTGACESATRTPVEVVIDEFSMPLTTDTQAFCRGGGTLADIQITGSGIVWYATATSTVRLPLTTPLTDGTTYYAAQSSGNCEGARKPVSITFNCFTLMGTVFPFVHEQDPAFNDLFPVMVKLYMVPPHDGNDPVENLLGATPLHTAKAQYYDGTVYVSGTPKHPGKLMVTNNPGLPIAWSLIGKTQGAVDHTSVTGIGDLPDAPVGIYKFEDVAPGEYVLELSRSGFLIRWAKITVTGDQILGHRELLPGDVNHDFVIDAYDMSRLNTKYTTIPGVIYDPKYDFNANGLIQRTIEALIIRFNIPAQVILYQETLDFLNTY